jgi:hypothetical protein
LAPCCWPALAYIGPRGRVLLTERNFFGVLRVTEDSEGKYHQLVHGNTLHGRQSLDPARETEPLAYYHRTGPIGQVFEMFDARTGESPANIAVIGLGAGSLACYATPTQDWTFYEIDPAVERIARDTNCFTFLKLSRAKKLDISSRRRPIAAQRRARSSLQPARRRCVQLGLDSHPPGYVRSVPIVFAETRGQRSPGIPHQQSTT